MKEFLTFTLTVFDETKIHLQFINLFYPKFE